MRGTRLIGVVGTLSLCLFGSASHAQGNGDGVYWHTDPGVKSCSMVIDPSLTQAQWSKFTRQASAIVSFKSLGPAETLGKMHFKIAIDHSSSPVDQHDPAWINTFTHPSTRNCPLGDVIRIPTIRAEMGVADNIDVGGYWTTAPDANYGLVGGELKYGFLQHSEKLPSVAVRTSASILTGVPDFNMTIYGVDLLASKKIRVVTPYVGFREILSIGTETTSKVDLDRETIPITQGYAGVVYSLWKVRLAAEYNVSFVNTLTFAVAFSS